MVVIIILLVVMRLWATDWVENLHLLVYLAFFASITGVALGYSRFSPLVCGFISTVYSSFIIGWLFGTTIEPEITWHDRILYHVGWRLRVTFTQLIAGESFDDPIFFLVFMSAALWLLGTSSTFLLVRKGAYWASVIPLGFVLLVINNYDQHLARNMWFLMIFLFLSLLILGRMTSLNYQRKWRGEGIFTTDQSHADLTKTIVMIATIIMILVAIIPINPQNGDRFPSLWLNITNRWHQFSDRFSSIFNFEALVPGKPRLGFFGEAIGLGTGTPESDQVVFTVTSHSTLYPEYRPYWRARSYDSYQDGVWTTSIELLEDDLLPEEFSIPYPEWKGEQSFTFTYTSNLRDMALLFSAGSPTGVDRPVTAITNPISDTEEDLIAVLAKPALNKGDSYQVESNIPIITVADLQESITEYPGWLDSYLQLPDDFSEKVKDIAEGIANKNPHPYFTTLDITHYLRTTIDYSRTLPEPPPGVDPIEWFLLDEKRGFCNYYATAQVLMLRSVGIPARLAVGYAQGDYDPATSTHTVLARDSHAWPEVYFPGYGWIIFEPTASQPPIIFPSDTAAAEDIGEAPLQDDLQKLEPTLSPDELSMDIPDELMNGETEPSPSEQIEFEEPGTKLWIFLVAGSVFLISTLFILFRKSLRPGKIEFLPIMLERRLINRGKSVPEFLQLWISRSRTKAIEKAYHQIGLSLRILGYSINPAETPGERGKALSALLPEEKETISDIVNEYEIRQYSNHHSSKLITRKASRRIRNLAIKTRFKRCLAFRKQIR